MFGARAFQEPEPSLKVTSGSRWYKKCRSRRLQLWTIAIIVVLVLNCYSMTHKIMKKVFSYNDNLSKVVHTLFITLSAWHNYVIKIGFFCIFSNILIFFLFYLLIITPPVPPIHPFCSKLSMLWSNFSYFLYIFYITFFLGLPQENIRQDWLMIPDAVSNNHTIAPVSQTF